MESPMAMAILTTDDARAHAGRVNDPDPEVPERATRRRYPAKYKLEILAEYDALDRDGKGALLRREGLYTSLRRSTQRQARTSPSSSSRHAPRNVQPASVASPMRSRSAAFVTSSTRLGTRPLSPSALFPRPASA